MSQDSKRSDTKTVVKERLPWQNHDWRGRHDAFIPEGNVPKLFRKKVSDFPKTPYLVPDPERVKKWGEWLSQFQRPYVGISWKGHTTRFIPPERLFESSATNINLQYNDTNEGLIQPPFDLKEDVEDVFALVKNLDWVNCCPVWILHVCGSMGVKCNVIRSPRVYGAENNIMRWEFGTWDRIDWYGNMTLYESLEAFDKR